MGLRFPEDHAFFVESYGPAFVHVHLTREGRRPSGRSPRERLKSGAHPSSSLGTGWSACSVSSRTSGSRNTKREPPYRDPGTHRASSPEVHVGVTMPVSIVVGGQYGSEGKGKVAHFLAKRLSAAVAIRVGGPNFRPHGRRRRTGARLSLPAYRQPHSRNPLCHRAGRLYRCRCLSEGVEQPVYLMRWGECRSECLCHYRGRQGKGAKGSVATPHRLDLDRHRRRCPAANRAPGHIEKGRGRSAVATLRTTRWRDRTAPSAAELSGDRRRDAGIRFVGASFESLSTRNLTGHDGRGISVGSRPEPSRRGRRDPGAQELPHTSLGELRSPSRRD